MKRSALMRRVLAPLVAAFLLSCGEPAAECGPEVGCPTPGDVCILGEGLRGVCAQGCQGDDDCTRGGSCNECLASGDCPECDVCVRACL